MPASLPLLHGEITLEDCLKNEDNILHQLSYPDKRLEFYVFLYERLDDIAAIVSHHLGLHGVHDCRAAEVKEWKSGSFNVCIPFDINPPSHNAGKRVLVRFPLPYKVGELENPGNAEEKLRCEVATYIWLQENCPTIPIPRLWGFGFQNGLSFTDPENSPTYQKLMWQFQRLIACFLRRPLPSRYIRHQCPRNLGVGYIIIEYIEETEAKMLLSSWEEHRHDSIRRGNLFKDLSHIMLTLSRIPQPRIASFRVDDHGLIHLDNRPLTLRLQHLENEKIPTNIERRVTYSSTRAYVLDLLTCHDNRIYFQPNSINDEYDGLAQLAALATMRTLIPYFLRHDLRNGPFVLILTDLTQANIFVDNDWHVKYIVDLEWTCSLPIEMLHPPWWLTSRPVDMLPEGEHLDNYAEMYQEFLRHFEEQERQFPEVNGTLSYCTRIMKRGWDIGNFFFSQALENPKGLYRIFLQNIQPKFERSHTEDGRFDIIVSPYWTADASGVIAKKLKDKEEYEGRLRAAFAEPEMNE